MTRSPAGVTAAEGSNWYAPGDDAEVSTSIGPNSARGRRGPVAASGAQAARLGEAWNGSRQAWRPGSHVYPSAARQSASLAHAAAHRSPMRPVGTHTLPPGQSVTRHCAVQYPPGIGAHSAPSGQVDWGLARSGAHASPMCATTTLDPAPLAAEPDPDPEPAPARGARVDDEQPATTAASANTESRCMPAVTHAARAP
ncbi:MAG: hypothetical protein IPL61_00420 [Myxococcales bacterium]|nr:hypothetical protein [Myxococcales bacterium]